jgi:hypothetical protein
MITRASLVAAFRALFRRPSWKRSIWYEIKEARRLRAARK